MAAECPLGPGAQNPRRRWWFGMPLRDDLVVAIRTCHVSYRDSHLHQLTVLPTGRSSLISTSTGLSLRGIYNYYLVSTKTKSMQVPSMYLVGTRLGSINSVLPFDFGIDETNCD